jgi:signal transduction histidine kinase
MQPVITLSGPMIDAKPTPHRRSLANRTIWWIGHYIVFTMTCAFVWFVAGFNVAAIVALSWGIGLASHGFFAVIAPVLRRRWTEEELGKHAVSRSHERRELEGRQARSLEELSASIAHEIRNPVTAAKSLVAQMGEDATSPDNMEYARVALEELERVERSIAHLLRYAREEELEVRDVTMRDVVDSALETFRERFARSNVTVSRELDTDGALRGDPDKLRRVVINLVTNALDALEEGNTPSPRIVITVGENLASTEVWMRCKDNGPGIPSDRLERVFSPFYTSKTNGTGLGLAISKKLAQAHGGTIEARSEIGRGTELTVVLPKRSALLEQAP